MAQLSYTSSMTTNRSFIGLDAVRAGLAADRYRHANQAASDAAVTADATHRAQQIRYEDQRDRGDVG